MKGYTISSILGMVDHELGHYISQLVNYEFHKVSDGCTVVSEVVVDTETGKDIVCMLHDWLYYTASVSKDKADRMLFRGYMQTGCFWVGLRRYIFFFLGGGTTAWRMHRRFGHSFPMWKQYLRERVRNNA